MKYVNRIPFFTAAFVLFLSLAASSASADIIPIHPGNVTGGTSPIITPAFRVDVNAVVSWVVTALGIVAALAALLWLIIGAIKWIISGGDKEKVAAARAQIIAAIIGLVIVILSFVILNFVISLLVPGANLFNLQIPNFQEAIQRP